MHWVVFRKKTEKERAGESSGDPIIVEPEWARVCRGGFRSQSGRSTDQASETGGTVSDGLWLAALKVRLSSKL